MDLKDPIYVLCWRGNTSIEVTNHLLALGIKAINIIGGIKSLLEYKKLKYQSV